MIPVFDLESFEDQNIHALTLDDLPELDVTEHIPPFGDSDLLLENVLSHHHELDFPVDEMLSDNGEHFDRLFSAETTPNSYNFGTDEDDVEEDDDEDDEEDDLKSFIAENTQPVKRKAGGNAPAAKRGKKTTKARARSSDARGHRDLSSEEAKRRIHNLSERNRRGNMKSMYHSLRTCIPELAGNDRPSNRTILSKAVDCIIDLQRQDREFEAQLAHLREENRRLLAQRK